MVPLLFAATRVHRSKTGLPNVTYVGCSVNGLPTAESLESAVLSRDGVVFRSILGRWRPLGHPELTDGLGAASLTTVDDTSGFVASVVADLTPRELRGLAVVSPDGAEHWLLLRSEAEAVGGWSSAPPPNTTTPQTVGETAEPLWGRYIETQCHRDAVYRVYGHWVYAPDGHVIAAHAWPSWAVVQYGSRSVASVHHDTYDGTTGSVLIVDGATATVAATYAYDLDGLVDSPDVVGLGVIRVNATAVHLVYCGATEATTLWITTTGASTGTHTTSSAGVGSSPQTYPMAVVADTTELGARCVGVVEAMASAPTINACGGGAEADSDYRHIAVMDTKVAVFAPGVAPIVYPSTTSIAARDARVCGWIAPSAGPYMASSPVVALCGVDGVLHVGVGNGPRYVCRRWLMAPATLFLGMPMVSLIHSCIVRCSNGTVFVWRATDVPCLLVRGAPGSPLCTVDTSTTTARTIDLSAGVCYNDTVPAAYPLFAGGAVGPVRPSGSALLCTVRWSAGASRYGALASHTIGTWLETTGAIEPEYVVHDAKGNYHAYRVPHGRVVDWAEALYRVIPLPPRLRANAIVTALGKG